MRRFLARVSEPVRSVHAPSWADFITATPELKFSVHTRAPKRIIDAHPPDQHAQLRVDLRSPSQWARLPTPVATKAGPVPTHERLGPDDCENLQDRWKPAIQLDKEPAIIVGEPDATMQPTPQKNQLMSKHRVLSLKPQLRPEWRGQDGQNETEQPDHSASLGDSITASTRIRFSVHTGAVARSPRFMTCSKGPGDRSRRVAATVRP